MLFPQVKNKTTWTKRWEKQEQVKIEDKGTDFLNYLDWVKNKVACIVKLEVIVNKLWPLGGMRRNPFAVCEER